MKQIFKFAAVMFAAMLLTNCVKENLEPTVPVNVGDAIIFGGRAGFPSNDKSRTVYTGTTYTYNGNTYEGINWVTNDIVAICSPDANAAADKNVIYRVSDHKTGQTGTNDHTRDYATLTPAYEGAGMQWGSNTKHTFYAMYPHQLPTEVDGKPVTLHQGVTLKGSEMTGIIPSSYTPTVTLNGNTYTATPDMRYAYMVAKTEHDPSTDDNTVPLSFVPVVTAVEIELLFPEGDATNGYYPITVGEIMLSSATQKLSGGFTADLAAWNPTSTATPTCELITSEDVASQNYVSISTLMHDSNTGIDAPITLEEGQSIKVTAFLLPHTDIADLTVSYASQGGYSMRSKSLAAAGTIPAKLKTRITKVKLPTTAIPVEPDPEEPDPGLGAENWMKELVVRKPDVTMAGLSLPGTGGSFTYLSTQNNSYRQQYKSKDTEMYSGGARTAAMDFDKQWSLGIRAFEITSDRPSGNASTNTLYTEQITCNKVDVDKTVGSAMEDIIKKVQTYPEETAVVILVYQPEDSDPGRNCNLYARAMVNMLKTLEDNFNAKDETPIFKLYTPSMKLSDAAGHVLVLARINQADEQEYNDDNESATVPQAATNWTNARTTLGTLPVVIINGCGTAKDKWGARGYKIDGVLCPQSSNDAERTNIIEYHMSNNAYLWANTGSVDENFNVRYPAGDVASTYVYTYWYLFGTTDRTVTGTLTRPMPLAATDTNFGLNFGYESYTGASTDKFKVWYQEWARVASPERISSNNVTIASLSITYRKTYWFESYYEKLYHAFTTYDMAVDNVKTDQIYINSLCGYLIDDNANDDSDVASIGSTYGGAGGDIQGLAKKITPQFYQYVLKRSKDNTTGPTGVVMQDYVSDNPAEGGSHYLPGLIIANNLKSN